MKKVILFILFIIFFILVLSTCASVERQGITYFVGKTENDLIKHFGYNGVVQSNTGNDEYDKIIFFTNKVIKYQVSKVNTIRYKVSRQSVIIDALSFYQFQDGCLVSGDTNYGQHYDKDMYGNITRHINDNASLVPIINQFNSIKNRNDSYPNSQRSVVFDRSRIGDIYYLYYEDRKSLYTEGRTLYSSEVYTGIILAVWRIDVVAEDRSETESYIIGQYYEHQNQYYSGNGNSVITVPQINSFIEEYRSKGFIYTTRTEGNSLLAYIKNGKVVRVGEKR
jgi:hypothetical protein